MQESSGLGIERPEVEFLILVDSAEVVNGKLYLLGGCYDRRGIVDFHQTIVVSAALAVLVPWNETNRPIPLAVSLKTPDDVPVAPPIQTTLTVGRPPVAVPGQKLRNVFTVQLQAQLPGPGQYVVEASVGDGPALRVVFFADQVYAPGQPPGGRPGG